MLTLELPRLRADQYAIAIHPAKRKEIAAGRRWGKSTMGGVLVMNVLRQHGKAAWITPTFANGRSLWRWIQRVAYPLVAEKRWSLSKTDRTITTHLGGLFAMYSDDNIDAIRGEDFDLVINDEASRIKEESIEEAIVPTLADRDGALINISTPRGRNWWYDQCQLAKADGADHMFYTAPSSANPNPHIQRAAALAQTRVARSVYEQEWLAWFVEDGLTLFTLEDIARASRRYQVPQIGPWITTVDVGRRRDTTVINTFSIGSKPYRRVAFERIERVPYPTIQKAIDRRARLYPGRLIVESNGIGDPVIENLEMRAEPFYTSVSTKVKALEGLQLLFEQGAILLACDDHTPDARERKDLIAANWTDHTPDTVMSLAIFAQAVIIPLVTPRARGQGATRVPMGGSHGRS